MTDQTAISSVTPEPGSATGLAVTRPPASRGRVVLAWSLGPAAAYALASLLQALVEGSLSIGVGFGRSLSFWVGAAYLALILWGFLPAAPSGWYARSGPIVALSALGALGLAVCGGFAATWLADHWKASVGGPVLLALAVVLVAAVLTLRLAGRADPPRTPAA